MDPIFWNRLFPFFIQVDTSLHIVAAGKSIQKIVPHILGQSLCDIGTLIRPKIQQISYSALKTVEDQLLLFRTEAQFGNHIFRGQVVQQSDNRLILGLSLWLTNIEQLSEIGLTLRDFALHDPILELLQLLKFQHVANQELRKQTAALKISQKATENALKARHEFMSVMTHEIRTPLSAIIGMGNILIEDDPKPDQLDHLKTLQFSSHNLLSLVNDVLDFSKMEAGKLSLERTEVDLTNLLGQITKTMEPKTQEKGIDLILHCDPNIPPLLWTDPGRLSQILLNLLGNAVKFTQEGWVKLSSQVIESEKEGWLTIRIEIEDTGIGIGEENVKKIFQPFTQAESSTTRSFGGTGLGLSITQKLIHLFDSNIELSSELGKGSTFGFELTLEIAENKENILSGTEIDLGHSYAILIAEDNQVNVKILVRYLDKWNIEYEIAKNGLEAVEKMRTKSFDLILMDLQMPVKDGYEASREIRDLSIASAKQIPIIALSASLFEEVEEKVLAAGMNDFLNKPFRPKELKRLLHQYLSLPQQQHIR